MTEKIKCIKCESENVIRFPKDIYITTNGNDLFKKPFYGCKQCDEAFVILNTEEKNSKNKVQKICSDISKKCNKILEKVG